MDDDDDDAAVTTAVATKATTAARQRLLQIGRNLKDHKLHIKLHTRV